MRSIKSYWIFYREGKWSKPFSYPRTCRRSCREANFVKTVKSLDRKIFGAQSLKDLNAGREEGRGAQ
jgi:hypothetical protein